MQTYQLLHHKIGWHLVFLNFRSLVSMFLYFLSLGEGTGAGQVRVLSIGEVHAYKHNRTRTPNTSQKQCPHQTNVANLKAFFFLLYFSRGFCSCERLTRLTSERSSSRVVFFRGQTLDSPCTSTWPHDTDAVHPDALKTAPVCTV